MRKLATIRKISEINPIPGADAIEVATVGGWKVVVKRGEFSVGDLAVYIEIDSWVPHELAPFLSKGQEPRVYNGVLGERLRTVKLRGQVSQGLLIAISAVYGKIGPIDIQEGRDITDLLGIQKWEAEIPASLAGQVQGPFPSWIRKTDQERCQNLVTEIFEENAGAKYEVTIKLDGSSMTVFARGTVDESDPSLVQMESGVCSRNLWLKVNEENANNTLVSVAVKSDLLGILEDMARNGDGNFAVQGEIMGPGIQGNRENLKTHQFFVFDIQNVDEGAYLDPGARSLLMLDLHARGVNPEMVKHVPIVAHSAELLDTLGIKNVEDLLKFADGKSLNHQVREGLVFKRIDGGSSFKAISNQFLLKGGE
jgi:RNA ligase (TIGR02306 family)